MFKLAVLISGSGTNLQALLDTEGICDIVLVVSDRAKAAGLNRAAAKGIDNRVIPPSQPELLLAALRERGAQGIVLAGYLSILPPEIVEVYEGKIINIHPSLIPRFCGRGFYGIKVHEGVLASGVRYTGATVHQVDCGVDTGAVVLQKTLRVDEKDTPEGLQQRVLEIEHEILVEAVKKLIKGDLAMRGRALVSVSDKRGVVEFARGLIDLGYEIVSTGGTAALLKENGLPITTAEEVTQFPECLDGRVKTLHPRIHGGILSMRDRESHMRKLAELDITPIDIVAVNLYPFRNVVENPGHTLEQAIENIDIGGPSMIRAAAKNYPFVTVVTEAEDYDEVLNKLREDSLDREYRFKLAAKAFAHTAAYDALISGYLNGVLGEDYPDTLTLTFEKKQGLRYGENSHQSAAYYQAPLSKRGGMEKAVCLHGKELSYNNINDAEGALALAREFSEPVCVAVKHATPCGVGIGADSYEAYKKAYEADPVSIFGGILCFNQEVDIKTAQAMSEVFLEVVIAPAYTGEALSCLTKKKNLRVMLLTNPGSCGGIEFKSVGGGLLVQQPDASDIDREPVKVVTKKAPASEEMRDLIFAMKVVKHVKSNGIVVAKDGRTLGLGGGEVSRIWAARAALERAGDKARGAVVASDAFFPFPDVVTACGEYGISAIIQPGGSINDNLSIEECDKQGIGMVFTGVRHFRH